MTCFNYQKVPYYPAINDTINYYTLQFWINLMVTIYFICLIIQLLFLFNYPVPNAHLFDEIFNILNGNNIRFLFFIPTFKLSHLHFTNDNTLWYYFHLIYIGV